MRKAYAPLWWYQFRHGTFHWTWKVTVLAVLAVGWQAFQTYHWSSKLPVCKRSPDAPASMQKQSIGTQDAPWQWSVTRCQEGWTDLRAQAKSNKPD